VSEPSAAVVVIGEEVLAARVTDVNSTYLCRRLTELGVAVRRVAVVPDEVAAIAEEVALCAARHTHVITTGGVGPTHDDVTMAGVALGLKRKLVRDPQAERMIRDFYGGDMDPSALRMAEVPEGTELVTGEGLRFPVVHVENVWVLPGSPHLCRSKFEAVQARFASTPFVEAQLRVNAGEPEIARFLGEVQARFADVAIGSYPQEPGQPVRLILTLKAKDAARVAAARQALEAGLGGMLAG
jgi:molybdenum cofactor synthesis domain-containing protein